MLSQSNVAVTPSAETAALFTLVETIEALSLARTIDQVAGVIRSAARNITGADGVAFVLRDGDQCFYLDEDAIGPLWKGRRFPLSACISGWSMLNGETAIIPDIYLDDRIPHDAYRPTFVKSLVMTPVRPRDPIAAIGAYWARERQPTEGEVLKLQVMARATAVALESGLLYASLTEALERRNFLMRELDHRCKNTLATVQSIADQTLRHAATPADFADSFDARLASLALAHEHLTREDWGRAKLDAIVATALEPFGGLDDGRVSVRGPSVTLRPESAVTMHMTLNELALNAVRYGALGGAGGQVAISWRVDMAAEPRRLTLEWLERGGPPVAQPKRLGFGARLVERGVARDLGGKARLAFEPEGVRYVLSVPFSERIGFA